MEAYSIYLMIQLAQAKNLMDKNMEYDLAWGNGQKLLEEFEASDFNVDTKSEYDCMVEFLDEELSKIPQHFEVCVNCGSTNVEKRVWEHCLTGRITTISDDDEDTWCNDCEGHHGLENETIY